MLRISRAWHLLSATYILVTITTAATTAAIIITVISMHKMC